MTNKMAAAGYDVIGDIHGHGDELLALLEKLGYGHDGECYRHSNRRALFLGDFVDRGPKQKLVLQTVMAMCRHGDASAIMGNHEFNALAYHTEHPAKSRRWLRPRTNKNTRQHLAFLNEYLGSADELEAVLEWFMELPLWLELELEPKKGLRAVHACWHTPALQRLRSVLGPGNTLTPELLVAASDPREQVYPDVDALLKGLELALPEGIFFEDKDGSRRSEVRIQWWQNAPTTFADLALPPYVVENNPQLRELALPAGLECGYDEQAPPVMFGHYWFQGTPQAVQPNVACLDYSVPQASGKLVAYRWSGESTLQEDNFVAVGNGAKPSQ